MKRFRVFLAQAVLGAALAAVLIFAVLGLVVSWPYSLLPLGFILGWVIVKWALVTIANDKVVHEPLDGFPPYGGF